MHLASSSFHPSTSFGVRRGNIVHVTKCHILFYWCLKLETAVSS